MTNPVDHLKTLQLGCTEAVAICEHIQTVLTHAPPTIEDDPYFRMVVNIPKITDLIWSTATAKEQTALVQPISPTSKPTS